MKKWYKYLGLLGFMIFSFYYTEKVTLFVINKSPLMKDIKDIENEYRVKSVNATIDGDYIIPGYNGLEVDVRNSYNKMNNIGTFSESLLVFKEMVPDLTLENYIDKVIIKGNENKKAVSIILNNNEILDYFIINNINADSFVYLDNYDINTSIELINGEVYEENFNDLDVILSKIKRNKDICLLPYNSEDICRFHQKYLVRPSLVLASYNIADIKSKVNSGDIIYISSGAKLVDVKILLKQIKFKNLEIIYLSDLISESR